MSSIVKIVPIKKQYNSNKFYEGSLAEQGYTRAPGTHYNLCPWKDASGKYRTGLDETASYIAFLNEEDRKLEVERIRSIRTDLENKSGLNLSPTSEYYRNLSTDGYLQLGDDPVILNREKYMDDITYYWVKSHPYIAPSLEEFNAYTTKQEINKCIAKLETASEEKMLSWAKMLGLRVGDGASKEKLYNELDTFLREGRTTTGIKTTNAFNDIVNLSAELLQVKVMIKDGLTYSVLRTGDLGTVYFGQDKLADSISQLEEKLVQAKNQTIKLTIEKTIKDKIIQLKLKA
jgi:hypothetical protein